ncbi:MAG: ATP-binding cassette domain-containing protein [Deltaproteobacteria bacterium]|nr:ATP-binding cassette domain-containing protein [Deltaproteobacteria bacterium]
MNNNLLQVEDLKTFFTIKKGFPNPVTHTVRAVDGISFHIEKGESFGLVGESGCGKSTAGRSILRLVETCGGKVTVSGKDIMSLDKLALRDMRRHMQIIFQDPYSALNPRHTIGKILSEPLLVHKLGTPDEIRERVLALLDEVGLPPEAAGKYPHEFSGGQRQRIGIARALLFKPELIIADEPVSALDVSIQSQVLSLMQNLQDKHNLSYLFISHDLAVVRYFCKRVAVMYLGRIVEQGAVKDVFDNPLHPYTTVLRSASPIPDPTLSRAAMRLEGEVPSPLNPPTGCHFHPRCPKRMKICEEEYPPQIEMENGRTVACHCYTK